MGNDDWDDFDDEEYSPIESRVSDLESKASDLESTTDDLESKTDEHETDINEIKSRLNSLAKSFAEWANESPNLLSWLLGKLWVIGTALSVVVSWERNHSILWGVLHGVLSWMYILYLFFPWDWLALLGALILKWLSGGFAKG
jgi:hypothetical protein